MRLGMVGYSFTGPEKAGYVNEKSRHNNHKILWFEDGYAASALYNIYYVGQQRRAKVGLKSGEVTE